MTSHTPTDSNVPAQNVSDGAPAGLSDEGPICADDASGTGLTTLRVDYIIPPPSSEGSFLIVTFSTPGNGDPHGEFARLLSQLFDSIMLTFRWTTQPVPDRSYGAE
jgi:hypothetical protein